MLPDWIELPPLRPYAYIDYRPLSQVFSVDMGGEDFNAFETLEEAYEFCQGFDFEITDRALQEAGAENNNGFITLPNNRLLLVLNNIERWDMLQNDYHQAADNIHRWRAEPNLDNAYYMLDTHPAFWTRHKEEPTWHWETNGHVNGFWFARGDNCWMMEAGGHTPDLTSTFHDIRLDVWGDTFEDCIMKMAELVDKFFNEDGTERENVEYEKSELELLLDERLKELD